MDKQGLTARLGVSDAPYSRHARTAKDQTDGSAVYSLVGTRCPCGREVVVWWEEGGKRPRLVKKRSSESGVFGVFFWGLK